MYVKHVDKDFPLACVGRIFKCVSTTVTFYKVNHLYKVHKYDYDDYGVVLENLTEKTMTSWNGMSAKFVEVLQEEQLSFNFS